MRRTTPITERLFPRLDVASDCWLWTGAVDIGGYGIISRGPRGATGTRFVHRAVWELLVGEIPEGYDLDHMCRVRLCCNPDHLQPVTRQENVNRGSHRAGAPRGRYCRSKRHEFTPENTARQKNGARLCKACANEAKQRYRDKQRREGAPSA